MIDPAMALKVNWKDVWLNMEATLKENYFRKGAYRPGLGDEIRIEMRG